MVSFPSPWGTLTFPVLFCYDWGRSSAVSGGSQEAVLLYRYHSYSCPSANQQLVLGILQCFTLDQMLGEVAVTGCYNLTATILYVDLSFEIFKVSI